MKLKEIWIFSMQSPPFHEGFKSLKQLIVFDTQINFRKNFLSG